MSKARSGKRGRPPAPGAQARRVAIEAVRRVDEDAAYANLLVPALLAESGLDQRDRNLVTELSYGATRMRRAVDWLVDRFVVSPPPPALRASLRVGAYQLAFMRVPPHAAVSATVEASAKRNRPAVNAILRKVADSLPVSEWPSDGVRLSYPDWLIARLAADLGPDAALATLETMNAAPIVTERDDGYIQDRASQLVVDVVDAQAADVVLDLCAAPGGKATALAARAGHVVAADVRPSRARLISANLERLGQGGVSVVAADGKAPPFPERSFDRVLVDAPCSGLGVLRRRPDARWRITAKDIEQLSSLQRELIDASVPLIKPGGVLVYSVCTLTDAETVEVATHAGSNPVLAAEPVDLAHVWEPHGSGARVLPHQHDTDGMSVFKWARTQD